MYKTAQKYEISLLNNVEINTAIIEKLTDTHDAQIFQTVVHMFEHSYLVTEDLSKQYNMPENIIIYTIRKLNSYHALKESGDASTSTHQGLFMFNQENGMWHNCWPDYTPENGIRHVIKILDFYGRIRTESQLVPSMREKMETLPRYVHKCYIRAVNPDYPIKSAAFVKLWFSKKEFNIAKRYFNAAYKDASKRMTNQNYFGIMR